MSAPQWDSPREILPIAEARSLPRSLKSSRALGREQKTFRGVLTVFLVLGALRDQSEHPVCPQSLVGRLVDRVRVDKTRRRSKNDPDIAAEML